MENNNSLDYTNSYMGIANWVWAKFNDLVEEWQNSGYKPEKKEGIIKFEEERILAGDTAFAANFVIPTICESLQYGRSKKIEEEAMELINFFKENGLDEYAAKVQEAYDGDVYAWDE